MEIKSRERELRDIIQKNRLEGRERQRERERERERERTVQKQVESTYRCFNLTLLTGHI